MDADDHELLRRYAHEGAEPAFAELVGRHLNLVYSAARRQTRSSELAQDIAQSVFIDLARAAKTFDPRVPVVAWLHLVTRRTAIDVIRRESRRLAREQAASEISAMKTPSSHWSQLEPQLDEVLTVLDETDRVAVLLRFFENKSLREVGEHLGASEEAARKRVSRALEQLRGAFLRRGIVMTSAGLAADLSAHAIEAAPLLLATNIAATAVTSTALQLATGPLTSFTMTMLEKTILTAGLVLTLGGALFDAHELRSQRGKLIALRQRADSLISETTQTHSQRDDALRRAAEGRQRLVDQSAIAADTPSDLAVKAVMAAWLDRTAKLRQLAIDRPELAIPEIKLLSDEEWFKAARSIQTETEAEIRQTLSLLRSTAESKFVPKLRAALRAYLVANADYLPADSHQLLPFFNPPIDPPTLDRYKMTASGKLSDLDATARNNLIEQRAPVDWEEDFIWCIGTTMELPSPAFTEFVSAAVQAFIKANNGARPVSAAQVQPFLRGTTNPARLEAFLKSQ